MASNKRRHPLILLVEEEEAERQAIAHYLEDAGYEVMEAVDTDRALALLESRSDLRGVVTDAHVPGKIDGYELAARVRRHWPDKAVVMMSGHSDSTSGPLPEGSEFVVKPYLQSRLGPALDRLLGRSA